MVPRRVNEVHRRPAARIDHRVGSLQLIACAGSGKTEVVARRVANLLKPGREEAAAPRNIIAFTFTDKAAAELKERIITRCREEIGEVPGLAEMFVGTIHAFCLELLKNEVPTFLKFEVLNEVQQALFTDRHSQQSGLTTSSDLGGQPLRRYRDTGHYLSALGILREAEPIDSVVNGCSAGLESYRALLEQRGYFDYSAILESAVDVLTNNEDVRTRMADRVRHVIVDEYQDVNPIQEAIVWLLPNLGAEVCVVGDDDQTIYQWRGSDVQNILSFATRYPNVQQVRLEENFRSSPGIVETARVFIEQNAQRLPKAMKPTEAQPHDAGDIVALSFDSPDAEAAYIAETIGALRGVAMTDGEVERGISWSDMAVLLRSVKANGEPITRALAAAAIPHVVAGMNNLFGTAAAEAARHLFYFMAGRPGVDAAALEAAWVVANAGVGQVDLKRAISIAEKARAALAEPDQKRWGRPGQGLAIRLTDERLAHILDHPEMVGLEQAIEETLLRPEQVIESFSDPTAKLHYRYYAKTLVGGKYLCVVVKTIDADAFVLTAYLTDKIKKGTSIWPKDA